MKCGGRFALEKRPETGLLAGLYGFPSCTGALAEKEAKTHLAALGFSLSSIQPLEDAAHVFTHVEWRMTGYLAEVTPALPVFSWKTPGEIRRDAALPSAFRAYKKLVLTEK